jgi:hypothetical protein
MRFLYCVFYLHLLEKNPTDKVMARWMAIVDTSFPIAAVVIGSEALIAAALGYPSLMFRAGSFGAAAIGIAAAYLLTYLYVGTDAGSTRALSKFGDRASKIGNKQRVLVLYTVISVIAFIIAWHFVLNSAG